MEGALGQVTKLPEPDLRNLARHFIACGCGSRDITMSVRPGDLSAAPPTATCRACGVPARQRPVESTNVVAMPYVGLKCHTCEFGAFVLTVTGRVYCGSCHELVEGAVVLLPTDDDI